MKKFFIILWYCCNLHMLWAQNNIVLLDVSGSMNGIKGENLMPKVREQLIPFVNSLDSASIKVIPFTNRVLGQFDAREFISRPIVAQKGNTNIQKAVSALPELMGEEVNRIFLVTDGQQTSGVSTEVFAQQLSALKEANEKDYYYLVALPDKVKETPIAGVFDGTNKFVLLDSLYFPEEHPVTQCEQDTTSSPVVSKLADVSGKENGSSFNWWWLLFIVLASLVVLLVIVVLLGYSSVLMKFICEVYYIVQSFAKKIYDNVMEKLRKLFSRDDKEYAKPMFKSMYYPLTFLPYIGSHYSSGGMFRRRVMVLGDSHYGDVPRAEITREVMRWYLDPETEREGWMNTFVKFERSLVGHETDWAERKAIWDSVMFYNYLQVLLSGPREAGTPEQYRDSAGAFYHVMEQQKPEVLIVWGKRLWDKLPGEGWEDGLRVEVDGYEVPNGYYNLKNGHRVRAFCVYHPSVGYDWGYWHKVIAQFL